MLCVVIVIFILCVSCFVLCCDLTVVFVFGVALWRGYMSCVFVYVCVGFDCCCVCPCFLL